MVLRVNCQALSVNRAGIKGKFYISVDPHYIYDVQNVGNLIIETSRLLHPAQNRDERMY